MSAPRRRGRLRTWFDGTRDREVAEVATVVEAAGRHGHSAIGYRRAERADRAPTYGVVLNPPRNTAVAFTAQDTVIVVAAA